MQREATLFCSTRYYWSSCYQRTQNSVTKEGIEKKLVDTGVGFGITNIYSTSAVGTSHTIHSEIDHGLNPVTTLTIANAGTGYGVGSGNTEYYYNANLVGYAGSTTGANATARVTVSAAGSITDVTIMDGGSSYGIGNTMSVVGIATTTGHSAATVTVAKIIDNVGDTVSITGIAELLLSSITISTESPRFLHLR